MHFRGGDTGEATRAIAPPPEPVGASVGGGGKRRRGEGERGKGGDGGWKSVKREKRGGCGVENVSPPVRTAPNYDDSPIDDSLPL